MMNSSWLQQRLVAIADKAAGRRWLPPELIENAVGRRDQRGEHAARFADILTEREQQVTFLVAEGLMNKEIAERLGVSEGTIKIHLHNIYKKLPVSNRTALANFVLYYRSDPWARRHGPRGSTIAPARSTAWIGLAAKGIQLAARSTRVRWTESVDQHKTAGPAGRRAR
jgi:DNA-binding CsgD family transcriptional regulator